MLELINVMQKLFSAGNEDLKLYSYNIVAIQDY